MAMDVEEWSQLFYGKYGIEKFNKNKTSSLLLVGTSVDYILLS